MKVLILETEELQTKGLQHLKAIAPDTLYVFPLVNKGMTFHSRNVPEPFEIAFLSIDFVVLEIFTVIPELGTAEAPYGTAMAVEAKRGTLGRLGFARGRRVSF